MEKEIEFYGKRIKFYEYGSGIPVVLLHGYLESSLIWGSFAEKLAAKYRVIAIDLPGHGQSETCGEIHTMEFMAKIIFELFETLNIEKAFIIGHSLGGYVTLAFLDLYPDKVSGICLFHSHPFADSKETILKRKREIEVVNAGKKNLMYPDNVTKMYADGNLSNFSSALERSKIIASQTPVTGLIAVLNGMMKRPSRAILMEKGLVPCLWLLGKYDNYINYEVITEKIKLPPDAYVVILEKSGHLGFIEEETESLKVIIKFINSNIQNTD